VVNERADGDAAIFTVVVSQDCPYFDGHFPHRRVLPAIGQLAIVGELVRRASGSSVTLTGVDGLRFSRPVSPGDVLEVRVKVAREDRTAAFEFLSEGARISRGRLRLVEGSGR